MSPKPPSRPADPQGAARPCSMRRLPPPSLPSSSRRIVGDARERRLIVIGAGKASAAMARAVEDAWPGDLGGLVVTRYGYGVPCARIEIVGNAHPVPDAVGLAAAKGNP